MIRIVLFAFAAAFALAAVAKNFETSCGGKTFRVEVEEKGRAFENDYRLVVFEAGKPISIYFSQGGFFHATCIKNKDRKEVFLFQNYCSGSACAEDKYGVVEPETLKLLLKPRSENVGNSAEAEKILGVKVPYLPSQKGLFCCE